MTIGTSTGSQRIPITPLGERVAKKLVREFQSSLRAVPGCFNTAPMTTIEELFFESN